MDTNRLLRIGNRIHLLLLRELGQGIDIQRLLREPLYARDVLLVCDAMPGSDLASLAQHFRRETRTVPGAAADDHAAASGFGADSSGFHTGFGTLSRPLSDFGPLAPPTPGTSARRWYSPARWLGGR